MPQIWPQKPKSEKKKAPCRLHAKRGGLSAAPEVKGESFPKKERVCGAG